LLGLADSLAEIRTQYFTITAVEGYCYICLLSLLIRFTVMCLLSYCFSDIYSFLCSYFPADFTKGQLDLYWTAVSSGQHFQLSAEDWNLSTSSNDSALLYACPRCTKRYKFRTSLNRHLKFECGKEPSFRCPHCSYMAKQKAPMQRHIRHTHGINT